MIRAARCLFALAPPLGIALAATAAHAVGGGDLDVLTQGRYVCELPGDAGTLVASAGRHVPDADFAIVSDSSYRVGAASGVYLLTGDHVVMTSGPGRGRAFHFVDESTLLAVAADGSEGPMRCVRSVQPVDSGGAVPACARNPADKPGASLTRSDRGSRCGDRPG